MYGSIMGGSGQIKVTSSGDINRAIGVAPHTPRQATYAQADDPNNFQKGTDVSFQNGIKKDGGSPKKNQQLSQA